MCIWLPRRWQLGMPDLKYRHGGWKRRRACGMLLRRGCISPPCLCERLSTHNIHHFILEAPHQMSSSYHWLVAHLKSQDRIYYVRFSCVTTDRNKKEHLPVRRNVMLLLVMLCTDLLAALLSSVTYGNTLIMVILSAWTHYENVVSVRPYVSSRKYSTDFWETWLGSLHQMWSGDYNIGSCKFNLILKLHEIQIYVHNFSQISPLHKKLAQT
jgi:hypothetical protein